MKFLKDKLVSPLYMWAIICIGIAIIFYFFSNEKIIRDYIFLKGIFLLCFFYWLYFITKAMKKHKKAYHSVEKIDKIITDGIYSRVRNPIYSADIVLSIGIFFLHPSYNVLASVLWMDFVMIFWTRLEERHLLKKFGKEYKDYMEKTPRLIPKFKESF